MGQLIDILVPSRLGGRIALRPACLVPGILVIAAASLIFLAGYGQATEAALAHLPPSAGEAERSSLRETFAGDALRNLSFLPFRFLLGWGLFAVTLQLSARAFLKVPHLRFAHYFSLVLYAEAIPRLGELILLLGFPLPGLGPLAPLGGGGAFLAPLLTSINLVTLWHLLVLSIGLSVLSGSRRRTSALAAGVVWAASLALNAGLLALLTRVFHFHQ
jgi:hypothetical protein